ncbi:hypothetical protein SHAM105786_12840 [Shewanella amazonensis]|uniref:Uncharacterized protein n=1 Tax=Shewanella amazonensis (strain ATCC BAA-1098 / SB2B) TaxID=326297 RepID=A1SBN7_SHEAM|nr:hypothetical protein [Shewanella amazonensis]ABM01794.1 hypothetical protein Sama_3591 [Shewanella amazonensis SB2B]
MHAADYVIYLVLALQVLDLGAWRSLIAHIKCHYPHIWHQAYSFDRHPGTQVRSNYIKEALKQGELKDSQDTPVVVYLRFHKAAIGLSSLLLLLGLLSQF